MIYVGKSARLTWGDGCFAEVATVSKTKRASSKPFRNWINNSILYNGQVFGRDEVGYYIVRGIVFREHDKHGYNATMMIYRLNLKRGWIACWENSHTTRTAYFLFRQNNKSAITTVETSAPRNRLAEVKGTKYYQLIG